MARTQVWGIKAPTLKPLVLGRIKLLQKHLVKKTQAGRSCGANLSLSPSGKIDDMLFFYLNYVFFIDVVSQYAAWYTSVSCIEFRIPALNHYTLNTLTYYVVNETVHCVTALLQPLQIYSAFLLLFGAAQYIKECRSQLVVLSLAPFLHQLSHVLCGCNYGTVLSLFGAVCFV